MKSIDISKNKNSKTFELHDINYISNNNTNKSTLKDRIKISKLYCNSRNTLYKNSKKNNMYNLHLASKNLKMYNIKKNNITIINKLCSCTICFENIDIPFYAYCGHKFHKNCIMKWIDYNKSCPVCKKKLYYKYDNNINTKSNVQYLRCQRYIYDIISYFILLICLFIVYKKLLEFNEIVYKYSLQR